MNNDRGFDTAQRRYDNAEPRDGGVEECDECHGKRWVCYGNDGSSYECSTCDGEGVVKL